MNKGNQMGGKENIETLARVDIGAFIDGTDAERGKIADQVDDICREIGFLIIENHGIDQKVIDNAWKAAEQFFALSNEQKLMSKSAEAGSPRGYVPVEGENLAKTIGDELPPDRKETFSSGPLSPPVGHHGHEDGFDFFYGDNIWPAEPALFQKYWIRYYLGMDRLGGRIMEMLAVALKLDPDFFIPYHTHHISALRTQNYPSLSSKILPGQLRAGTHSDYGSVTILRPDPLVDGLEVKSPHGGWIKAPVVSDGFIINIGDLLARWTNDRWVSTLHRVVEPEHKDGETPKRRQSIAYFMNPNYDGIIETIPTCLKKGEKSKYAPVSAGDYLMAKFRQST
ncbi:MAG: 2-oxoglutarate and iron-dependent oxygenase domain-containing protein [Emcibacteraceae bacterium]